MRLRGAAGAGDRDDRHQGSDRREAGDRCAQRVAADHDRLFAKGKEYRRCGGGVSWRGLYDLAIDLEGTEVCDWLTSKGITCVLLKYRVPDSARRGITIATATSIRRRRRRWKMHKGRWDSSASTRPSGTSIRTRSACWGFRRADIWWPISARTSHKRAYAPVDAADKVSCRPDFAVAIYPGHMLENTTKEFELNPEIPVTAKTPPTFLLQAEDDNVDGVKQSLVYYIALKNAGVPVEMHLYAQGGHAFGLRRTKFPITEWPRLVNVAWDNWDDFGVSAQRWCRSDPCSTCLINAETGKVDFPSYR